MELSNKDLERSQGVYIIKQKSTGKFYVSKSFNVRSRVTDHIKGRNPSSLISKAITEFGVDDFDLNVKYQPHLSPKELVTYEYVMIRQHRSMKPFGFNQRSRGWSNAVSDETRAKISDACKGKIVSLETRAKISDSHKGKTQKPHSTKTRAKMSDAWKFRESHSHETRKKISDSSKGRKHTLETRKKLSIARKARSGRQETTTQHPS